jgi:ribosomal protein L20A (L18A)
MKKFKVEGWYRYSDEKDFETLETESVNLEDALGKFLDVYCRLSFYKIDIKEIV